MQEKEEKQDVKKLESLLYVEDDDDTREEVTFFLKTRVENLYIAKDGKEGLELFIEKKPNIIVTDIQMPIMNGLEMAEEILKIQEDTNIVFLTAFNDSNYLHEAIRIGVKEYLTKPIDFNKLSTKLDFFVKKIHDQFERAKNQRLMEEYKVALDKSNIFIKLDLEGKLSYVNSIFCDMLGYSEEDSIGCKLEEFRLNRPITEQIIFSIKQDKEWRSSFQITSKDGQEAIFDGNFFPMKSHEGEINGCMGILNNVTELYSYRKIIHTDLKQPQGTNEQNHYAVEYNKILENGIAMCRMNFAGKILRTSKAFNHIFKATSEEFKNSSFPAVVNWSYSSFENMRKFIKEKKTFEQTLSISINGKMQNLVLQGFGIFASDNSLEDMIIIFTDISFMNKKGIF